MSERRCILHADMDAFFASVEIRDRPELRGKPVIVGGLSDRGVVCAASYEARVFGVHSAMPTFQARKACPQGIFLPPDMERYALASAQIHDLFLEITPEIEPIALDEAFLDITHSLKLLGQPEAIGQSLKARVRERTRLTVSVGISTSKLVAKIACTLGKPDGLKVVAHGEEGALLAPLPIRKLWGIGPVAAQSLEQAGIRRIGELAACSEAQLETLFGRRSRDILQLARGYDLRPVESNREAKSYGEECTFERDTLDRDKIVGVLSAHAEAVARRLRRDQVEGKTVSLRVRLGRVERKMPDRTRRGEEAPHYPLLTRARTLAEPTSEGGLLLDVAVRLWDELRLATPVRLVGISVSGLRAAGKGQLSLFQEKRADRRVGEALDAIEARFGRGIIHRGAAPAAKLTPTIQRKRGE